jgi:hypothetical protein
MIQVSGSVFELRRSREPRWARSPWSPAGEASGHSRTLASSPEGQDVASRLQRRDKACRRPCYRDGMRDTVTAASTETFNCELLRSVCQ